MPAKEPVGWFEHEGQLVTVIAADGQTPEQAIAEEASKRNVDPTTVKRGPAPTDWKAVNPPIPSSPIPAAPVAEPAALQTASISDKMITEITPPAISEPDAPPRTHKWAEHANAILTGMRRQT